MAVTISNGVVIGAVYAIVALGLVLIYKSSRTLNFAHAETGMIGAFVFATLWSQRGWPYSFAALIGILSSGLIATIIYAVLLRRAHSPLAMLLGTLAVAGILVSIAVEVWGPDPFFFPSPPLANAKVSIAGLTFVGPRLVVVIASAALALALFVFFRWSRAGLIFRAISIDPYAAELMGVNVRRSAFLTWFVAGVLAGTAAVLVAPIVNFHVFFMSLLFARALAALLLAGMMSIGGSFIAALLVGIAEAGLSRATTQIGVPEAMLVLIMILILVLRPAGLFAKAA